MKTGVHQQGNGASRRSTIRSLTGAWFRLVCRRLPRILQGKEIKLLLLAGVVALGLGGKGPEPKADLLVRVGSWPAFPRGPAFDVAVADRFAYVALGEGGLLILDVSQPAQPVRVGSYRAPGRTESVRVVADRAYLATRVHRGGGCDYEEWRGVLVVLDVSNPSNPVLLSTYTARDAIRSLSLDGNRLYLGIQYNSLHILDVTNASQPVLLGIYSSGDQYSCVSPASGQRVWYGGNASINLLDASQPSSPLLITNIPTYQGYDVRGLQVTSNRLFVVESGIGDPGFAGLSIYDITPGMAVKRLGGLEFTNQMALDLKLIGNRGWIAAAQKGVVAVNVSDPAHPVLLGTCDTPGHSSRIEVMGTNVFAADFHGGLQIIDAREPARMTLLSGFDTGLTAREVRVAGGRAYLLSSDKDPSLGFWSRSRLEILDVKNPAQPALIGAYAWPFSVMSLDIAGGVASVIRSEWITIAGAQYNDCSLQLFDVSNPAQPRFLSDTLLSTNSDSWDNGKDAILSGAYAYATVSGSDGGLSTLDVSDPARPVLLSRTNYCYGRLQALGQRVYVTDGGSINVFDMSNPRAPVWLGNGGNGTSTGFRVTPDYAYGSMGWGGFWIQDVRSPTNIVWLGSYNTEGESQGLWAEGNRLFVAEGWEGLEVFDVAQPELPIPIGGLETRGQAREVEVSGAYAYVAEGGAGLAIMSLPPGAVTVIEDPASIRVAAGDYASLTVRAYGVGPLTYQWYFGESGDTSHPVAGATNSTLTAVAQAGAYWARVSGATGFTDSRAGWITLAPRVSVDLVGLWPGYPRGSVADIAINGNIAYFCQGTGLTIYDFSTVSSPRLVGVLALGGNVSDMAISGNRAFLANSSGLQILDITDPVAPVPLGQTNLYGYKIVIAATNAYLMGDLLRIVDVSDPAQPHFVGSSAWTGNDFDVQGGYAFITGYDSGLNVVDVRNPAQPRWLTQINPYGNERAVRLSNNFAYVGSTAGLGIFDVSNPANFSYRSQVACGEVGGMFVSGSRVYVTGSQGLQIIDASNPWSPIVIGSFSVNRWAYAITVSGNRAYVYFDDSFVRVIDVADAAHPGLLGLVDVGGYSQDVVVSGGHAFLAEGPSGLSVIDVSSPSHPVRIGLYQPTNNISVQRVAAGENVFYLGGDSLQALNISDPAQPVLLGGLPEYSYDADLVAAGDYLYLGGDELRIIDVRSPAAMQVLSRFGTDGLRVQGIAVSGSYAYMARGNFGLHIYDRRLPGQLVEVVMWDTQGYSCDVAVGGNLAYFSHSGAWGISSGVDILDVSNPAHPARISTVAVYDPLHVKVAGRYAFVSTSSGLQVIDVADPYRPVLVGYQEPGIQTTGFQVDGDLIYAAAGEYGLAIYRVTPLLQLDAPTVAGNKLRLKWVGGPGIRLQRTTSLTGGSWEEVPYTEGLSSLELSLTNVAEFFRLISQ